MDANELLSGVAGCSLGASASSGRLSPFGGSSLVASTVWVRDKTKSSLTTPTAP